jgi:hypothetical protein
MKARELLEELNRLTEEQLDFEIRVVLCNPNYPTGDGDYDTMYYEYETITGGNLNQKTFDIFGYV